VTVSSTKSVLYERLSDVIKREGFWALKLDAKIAKHPENTVSRKESCIVRPDQNPCSRFREIADSGYSEHCLKRCRRHFRAIVGDCSLGIDWSKKLKR